MSREYSPHEERLKADRRIEPEPLTVIVECPACGGDRGWESAPYGVDYRDGSVLTSWITCNECNATGGVEVPVELVDEYDLDEIPMPA